MICYAAYYLPQNAGDIARKFIKDPEVLSFIDAEVGQSCPLKVYDSSLMLLLFWNLPCTNLSEFIK